MKLHKTLKHSPFNAMISALDEETSALGTASLALGAATSALARSFQRHRRGVSGDIGNCRVGITPQMCNRITNHANMSTFSKQVRNKFSLDRVRGLHDIVLKTATSGEKGACMRNNSCN